jgi:hypothetical protein
MKSIVVNKILVVTGFLILTTVLEAQKPAIDLISTYQQNRHPEAIVDTGFALKPLVRETIQVQAPPVQTRKLTDDSGKKRRHQIGPSLDSIFQKEDKRSNEKDKASVKISFFNRKYNPLKILIYITAIN